MTEKLLLSLSKELARETDLMEQHAAIPIARKLGDNRQRILSGVKTIGKMGDLEKIVAGEKILIERDLADHANSPRMETSLKEAKVGLETIETHIGLISNPEKYQAINESNSLKKMRDSRDLPLDGARQAFRAHQTRLGNLDVARLDINEKTIIQVRQQNIRIAEKLYIGRQEKALGIEPKEQIKPQQSVPTQAQYEKYAAQILAKLEANGIHPKSLAAIREGINQGIRERTQTPATEKSPSAVTPPTAKPPLARKPKQQDDPEIER
jgi:hypothetical protein